MKLEELKKSVNEYNVNLQGEFTYNMANVENEINRAELREPLKKVAKEQFDLAKKYLEKNDFKNAMERLEVVNEFLFIAE